MTMETLKLRIFCVEKYKNIFLRFISVKFKSDILKVIIKQVLIEYFLLLTKA